MSTNSVSNQNEIDMNFLEQNGSKSGRVADLEDGELEDGELDEEQQNNSDSIAVQNSKPYYNPQDSSDGVTSSQTDLDLSEGQSLRPKSSKKQQQEDGSELKRMKTPDYQPKSSAESSGKKRKRHDDAQKRHNADYEVDGDTDGKWYGYGYYGNEAGSYGAEPGYYGSGSDDSLGDDVKVKKRPKGRGHKVKGHYDDNDESTSQSDYDDDYDDDDERKVKKMRRSRYADGDYPDGSRPRHKSRYDEQRDDVKVVFAGLRKTHKDNYPGRKPRLADTPMDARPVCFFYKEGKCLKGDECPFNHNVKVVIPERVVCRHFQRAGYCNFGDECKFLHQRVPNKNSQMDGERRSKYMGDDEASFSKKSSSNHGEDDLLESGGKDKKIPSLLDLNEFPEGEDDQVVKILASAAKKSSSQKMKRFGPQSNDPTLGTASPPNPVRHQKPLLPQPLSSEGLPMGPGPHRGPFPGLQPGQGILGPAPVPPRPLSRMSMGMPMPMMSPHMMRQGMYPMMQPPLQGMMPQQMQPGPMQQGPMQQGPMQQSFMQQGPIYQDVNQQGPMQQDQIQQGHIMQGQMSQGQMSHGQMIQGQMQQGPMQQGQMQQGPMQQGQMQGPMQQGQMQQGPMQQGQMQQGPMQQGQMQQGLMQQGQIHQSQMQSFPQGAMQQGPMQQGPMQQRPMQQGPIQQGPVQQGSQGSMPRGQMQQGFMQPGQNGFMPQSQGQGFMGQRYPMYQNNMSGVQGDMYSQDSQQSENSQSNGFAQNSGPYNNENTSHNNVPEKTSVPSDNCDSTSEYTGPKFIGGVDISQLPPQQREIYLRMYTPDSDKASPAESSRSVTSVISSSQVVTRNVENISSTDTSNQAVKSKETGMNIVDVLNSLVPQSAQSVEPIRSPSPVVEPVGSFGGLKVYPISVNETITLPDDLDVTEDRWTNDPRVQKHKNDRPAVKPAPKTSVPVTSEEKPCDPRLRRAAAAAGLQAASAGSQAAAAGSQAADVSSTANTSATTAVASSAPVITAVGSAPDKPDEVFMNPGISQPRMPAVGQPQQGPVDNMGNNMGGGPGQNMGLGVNSGPNMGMRNPAAQNVGMNQQFPGNVAAAALAFSMASMMSMGQSMMSAPVPNMGDFLVRMASSAATLTAMSSLTNSAYQSSAYQSPYISGNFPSGFNRPGFNNVYYTTASGRNNSSYINSSSNSVMAPTVVGSQTNAKKSFTGSSSSFTNSPSVAQTTVTSSRSQSGSNCSSQSSESRSDPRGQSRYISSTSGDEVTDKKGEEKKPQSSGSQPADAPNSAEESGRESKQNLDGENEDSNGSSGSGETPSLSAVLGLDENYTQFRSPLAAGLDSGPSEGGYNRPPNQRYQQLQQQRKHQKQNRGRHPGKNPDHNRKHKAKNDAVPKTTPSWGYNAPDVSVTSTVSVTYQATAANSLISAPSRAIEGSLKDMFKTIDPTASPFC